MEISGRGGWGKRKGASEGAGMCDHGGQRKRKGWPRAPRPARLKTTLYRECLTLDHPNYVVLYAVYVSHFPRNPCPNENRTLLPTGREWCVSERLILLTGKFTASAILFVRSGEVVFHILSYSFLCSPFSVPFPVTL